MPSSPSVDLLTLTVYGGDMATEQIDTVRRLYAEVYAEPPYLEDAEDVEQFVADWPRRVGQPSFRLVIARHALDAIGFTFGHRLPPTTGWWNGALTPLPGDITAEYPGRTFAVIELAVRQPYRRHRVAGDLHAHLLAGLTEERVTLLVRPDAPAALHAYQSWGYRQVGKIRPFEDAPIYLAMIKRLPN